MTLVETKEWLNDIWNILVDANICRTNSIRIITTLYENEDSIKKRGFFNRYLFQLKFIMAIQLCKVLDDNPNQKRNFNKLLRRLECETWHPDLVDVVASNAYVSTTGKEAVLNEVKLIQAQIESKKELIQSLVRVRNQNYAHFDPVRDKSGPSVKKYEEAVVFASQMYNNLSFVLFGTTTHFDHMDDWEIDPILKSLSKELTRWLDERGSKHGS